MGGRYNQNALYMCMKSLKNKLKNYFEIILQSQYIKQMCNNSVFCYSNRSSSRQLNQLHISHILKKGRMLRKAGQGEILGNF